MRLLPVLPLCACGCGQQVRLLRNRYVVGHNFRVISAKSEKTRREKIRNFNRGKKWPGRVLTEAHRANIGAGVVRALQENGGAFNKGWQHTEEWKRANSLRHKGNKHALGSKHTEEWKRANSERMKGRKYPGRIQTEESNKKRAETLNGRPSPMKGRHQSEEARKQIGAAQKGNQHALGYKHTTNWKRAQSKRNKLLWADPEYHKKTSSKMAQGARLQRPNKAERALRDLLDQLQPNEWKYVGDGSVVLGGKNPDFINVNGKKLIIELFGDHWHRNDDPKKRASVFKPFGFRTLVIWERELKEPARVDARVLRFTNR